MYHCQSGWTFRFCSVANALALSHDGTAILHVGGVSSDPIWDPKATHQLASPTEKAHSQAINILIEPRAKIDNYVTSQNRFMKRVILITGTPCVGKTTTAKQLAAKLDAEYINLTDYAKTNDLTLGEDKERQTTIIRRRSHAAKTRRNHRSLRQTPT